MLYPPQSPHASNRFAEPAALAGREEPALSPRSVVEGTSRRRGRRQRSARLWRRPKRRDGETRRKAPANQSPRRGGFSGSVPAYAGVTFTKVGGSMFIGDSSLYEPGRSRGPRR